MSQKKSNKIASREQRNDLAVELFNAGKLAEAGEIFRQLLVENPKDAVAVYHWCLILLRSQAIDACLQLTLHGVAIAGGFAPMWAIRAAALQAAGQFDEALAAFENALKLDPRFLEVLINSGTLLRRLQRHREAVERFNAVLVIDPNNQTALANCGIVLSEFPATEVNTATLSIRMFERLVLLNPAYPNALGLLCTQRLHISDWTNFEEVSADILTGVRRGERVCKPLGLMAISDSASDHGLAARVFAQSMFVKSNQPLWKGERYGHAKLRLAYVSPDFREHPVGHLMAGVFEHHDRTHFETIAISLGNDDGSRLRKRMEGAFDHFVDVKGLGFRQIAETMRKMEVDVAIDLAGYTSNSGVEVFTHRPAAVQATFLGYPGTLGGDFMDFIVADRHVIPPQHQQYYTEKVAYLPDSYLPTDSTLKVSDRTPTRAEAGLPENGPVLCSFSHDYKIHPHMFASWMRILQQRPDAHLWLVSRNPKSQVNLRNAASAHGIAPERLVFATRVPLIEDHLARYRLADLFLDTSPYNAHTTAADALMAGLPVVTLDGNSFPSRVAASLLHTMGLPELIAPTPEAYETMVLHYLNHPDELAQLKAKLAGNQVHSALFDTRRFCRNFEQVVTAMHAQTFTT